MSELLSLSKKIVLLGDPAVGKTSLIRKFVYDMFNDNYITTLGAKVSRKRLIFDHPTKDIKIEMKFLIWDIMGQKEYAMVQQSAFMGAQGAIIVCDVTRRKTLESSINWITNLFDIAGEIPLVLIGNKCDLSEQKQFQYEDLANFVSAFSAPAFLASAKTGENVEISFTKLGEHIVKIDFGE